MRRPVVSQAQQRAPGQVQLQAPRPQREQEVRELAEQEPVEQRVLVVQLGLAPVLQRERRQPQVPQGPFRPQ